MSESPFPPAQDLYRAAVRLARAGQPVFPCYSELTEVRGKMKKPKSPMVKWQDAATVDPAQIKRWWRREPTASIGIPTGIKFDVLDVDPRKGADGREHLVRLTNLGLLSGCKRVIKTPSGGFHLYFNPNPQLTNKVKASFGLDVRAKGGYVLAPPSYIIVNEDSKQYEGSYVDLGPTDNSTDDVLQWDMIRNDILPVSDTGQEIELPPLEQQRSIAGLKHRMSTAVEGERNPILFWAVNRCIENGFDPHELMDAALLAGLGEDEILQTINSGLKTQGVRVEELGSEMEVMVADMFPDEDEVDE